MTQKGTITLNILSTFTANDDNERTIFDICKKDVINEYLADTKSTWSNGTFYLGGFIKMKPDEEITLKQINEVKIIRDKKFKEYGGHCNGAEIVSILRSDRQLNEIEEIVKKYLEIVKYRYLIELEKTKLNNDVNNVIVSYAL
jgi:hypothetical protein